MDCLSPLWITFAGEDLKVSKIMLLLYLKTELSIGTEFEKNM